MGKYLRHPEAKRALLNAAAAARDARVRERCTTPGFGFLVLLYRQNGTGATPYDTTTYAEAKAIVNRELPDAMYASVLIVKKVWNPEMSLTSDRHARDRWVDRRDEDQ